jgi:F5/8 type C domain
MKLYQIKTNRFLHSKAIALSAACALVMNGTSSQAQITSNGLGIYAQLVGLPNATASQVGISNQYTIRIRPLSATNDWRMPFTLQTIVPTASNEGSAQDKKYYANLSGFTHSYVNFEMTNAVVVEVSKISGSITSATKVYPESKARNLTFAGGKLYFTIDAACNVAVDIDGLMATRNTTIYTTTPIHTLSVHGNSTLAGKPASSGDSTVYYVSPGSPRSTYDGFITSGKKTLYFMPGVHNLHDSAVLPLVSDFKVYANKHYYISGESIVNGTFNNEGLSNVDNIRIFGHGTISGSLYDHWDLPIYSTDSATRQSLSYRQRPIHLGYCKNGKLEGVTLADPANNSIIMHNPGYDVNNTSYVNWVKVFGWRTNSDGGGCNDNSEVTNNFYRTQDDGLYPAGKKLSDNVMWVDSNGANLRLSFLPNFTNGRTFRIEAIDVIFRRNLWWSGSACIDQPFRRNSDGTPSTISRDHGQGVTFSNHLYSDATSTKQAIAINQSLGTFSGVRFEDITIVNDSLMNELLTEGGGTISGLTFHNLVIGGALITASNWREYFDITPGGSVSTPSFTSGNYSRKGWKVTSSHNTNSTSQNPSKAIDGDSATRWSTGTFQVPSPIQWYKIDMLATRSFNEIELNAGTSVNDYPRGYVVEVSNDDVSWTNVNATGTGTPSNPSLKLTFGVKKARYVRITQTGSSPTYYWSIHELNIKAAQAPSPVELVRTGWTASASHNSSTALNAINAITTDRWTSGSPQIDTNPFTYTVSLNGSKSFNKMVVDAGTSTNDYPRQFEVSISNDGTTFGSPIASGYGSGAVLTINFPSIQTATHVRIKQVGSTTGGNYWSIAEFRIFN